MLRVAVAAPSLDRLPGLDVRRVATIIAVSRDLLRLGDGDAERMLRSDPVAFQPSRYISWQPARARAGAYARLAI